MLSFDEAQKRILALAAPLGKERVTLAVAHGRVLAEDMRAELDAPAFDASTMDGYAVFSADVGDGAMQVAGESRAGGAGPSLTAKTACRIFTGAPLPIGADAVIMQEEATREGDRVRFSSRPRAGAFVRRRGEDLAAGEVALSAGTRLGASGLAMLASLDHAEAIVGIAPRVVILPTGDELRSPGVRGAPSSIPESNSPALGAMARACGASVDARAPISDDPDTAKRAIEHALLGCDLLVTIGGVSVGDHDVVKPALEASGVTLDFWRVAIKPGKPLAVGRRGKTIVLGLPGNPVSAMVTFALFGVPLLRAMQGDVHPFAQRTRGRLMANITRKTGRLEFARARVSDAGVAILAQQASGSILGLCRANALACFPADAETLAQGSEVDLFMLAELGL